MGCYDTYGKNEIQIKAGDRLMRNFKIGDKITDLHNGLYIGYEGAIVIKKGVFVEEFDCIYDKWGNRYNGLYELHNAGGII